MRPCVAWLGEAAHDELLAELDFQLEPISRANAWLVFRVDTLRDDAFPVVAAGSREELFAIARASVAKSKSGGRSGPDKALEPSSSNRPGLIDQHLVTVDEQVE